MKQLFQFCKQTKGLSLPIVALSISLATSAQPYLQKPVVESREIELTEAFNEIEVAGDVTIILTDNLESKVVFYGDAQDVQTAKAFVRGKKLVIDAFYKKRFNKFTVYVPVSNVRSLVTSGKTEIFSSGAITTRDLEILLNGSSRVSINHIGKLNVRPGSGYELVD